MAAGMSARDTIETQEYGTIIVVGGGCYGVYYVQQLQRARAAGALIYERITVVDHDPACAVVRQQTSDVQDVQLECSDWSSFFDRYLAQASQTTIDAIVPSPLMPHLMY